MKVKKILSVGIVAGMLALFWGGNVWAVDDEVVFAKRGRVRAVAVATAGSVCDNEYPASASEAKRMIRGVLAERMISERLQAYGMGYVSTESAYSAMVRSTARTRDANIDKHESYIAALECTLDQLMKYFEKVIEGMDIFTADAHAEYFVERKDTIDRMIYTAETPADVMEAQRAIVRLREQIIELRD